MWYCKHCTMLNLDESGFIDLCWWCGISRSQTIDKNISLLMVISFIFLLSGCNGVNKLLGQDEPPRNDTYEAVGPLPNGLYTYHGLVGKDAMVMNLPLYDYRIKAVTLLRDDLNVELVEYHTPGTYVACGWIVIGAYLLFVNCKESDEYFIIMEK